jgi:hypothetical protein
MRRFWDVFGFVAIAHVIALIVLVGWLVQSGRLDADAVRQIRGALGMETAEMRPVAPPPAPEASLTAPGVSSAEQIERIEIESYRVQQLQRRHEDEIEEFRGEIVARTEEQETRQAALDAQESAFVGRLDAERAKRDSEQFRQTVRLYESIPPRNAKALILTALRRQRHDDVIAVLAAMRSQQVARILREFRTAGEIELADQILDELRHHGALDDVEPVR